MAEKKIRKTKAEIDKNNIEEENDIYKIDIEPEEKNNKNVIKVIDDEEINILFNSSVSPCLIKPLSGNEYEYLVLPVRITNN